MRHYAWSLHFIAFEIQVCMMVFVLCACEQHSFAAMAQLVASCERRSEWDVLYERTLHILLRQVQEDKRYRQRINISKTTFSMIVIYVILQQLEGTELQLYFFPLVLIYCGFYSFFMLHVLHALNSCKSFND